MKALASAAWAASGCCDALARHWRNKICWSSAEITHPGGTDSPARTSRPRATASPPQRLRPVARPLNVTRRRCSQMCRRVKCSGAVEAQHEIEK
jgi:hypothetical protein